MTLCVSVFDTQSVAFSLKPHMPAHIVTIIIHHSTVSLQAKHATVRLILSIIDCWYPTRRIDFLTVFRIFSVVVVFFSIFLATVL